MLPSLLITAVVVSCCKIVSGGAALIANSILVVVYTCARHFGSQIINVRSRGLGSIGVKAGRKNIGCGIKGQVVLDQPPEAVILFAKGVVIVAQTLNQKLGAYSRLLQLLAAFAALLGGVHCVWVCLVMFERKRRVIS